MPALNPFHYMEEIHIDQVFDELEERFGFPKKIWKAKFKEHLGRQRKDEDNLGIFLRFGNEHINDTLNRILLRGSGHSTLSNLCEYIIRRSPSFQSELNKHKRFRSK